MNPPNRLLMLTLSALMGAVGACAEDVFENAPIHYSETKPNDAAQRLERDLASGKVKIDRKDEWSVLMGVMDNSFTTLRTFSTFSTKPKTI